MATIEAYDTKAGRRYRVRYRKPDRRQTDKRGFTTMREAKAFAATVETSKLTGTYVDHTAGRVTVGELAHAWLSSLTGRRETTITQYRSTVHTHIIPTFGPTPVADLTTAMVRTWVAELAADKATSTVLRAHQNLACILDDAVEDRRIPINPSRSRSVRLPAAEDARKVYLTYQQMEAAAVAAGAEDARAFVLLGGYVGLRWGEIAGLRPGDLDVISKRINIRRTLTQTGKTQPPKSGRAREVRYPAFLGPLLSEAFDDPCGEWLLPRLKLPRTDFGWWARVSKEAHLPAGFRFHDLRHSAASFAVSAGANVKLVQTMLGHASAKVTLDTYAALFDQDANVVADRVSAAREAALG